MATPSTWARARGPRRWGGDLRVNRRLRDRLPGRHEDVGAGDRRLRHLCRDHALGRTQAGGVGLLGPVAHGGLGVPALPDGTQLPATTDRHQAYVMLYGQFADAWRVTDATTLFDYDSGKSTASYTIKPYPTETKVLTLADLSPAQLAAGQAACSAITDSRLRDQCVFDVGVTGDAGFAGSYAIAQAFMNTPLARSASRPRRSRPCRRRRRRERGRHRDEGTALGGYAVGPDDTVYLSVQTGDNDFSLIAFDPKAGKVAAR